MTFVLSIIPSVGFTEQLKPSSTSIGTELYISGSIVDNYANISYSYPLKNQVNNSREYSISVPVFSGLRLSNVSIIGSNYSLWGRIHEVEKSEQIYNQTVEQNLTGAIIYYQSFSSAYFIRFNLKGNESVVMTTYFEGILPRIIGEYSLQLANSEMLQDLEIMNLDISVRSTLVNFVGLSVKGLNSAEFSGDTNTYTISYSGQVVQREDMILTYSLTNYLSTSSIITYNNGSKSFFSYFLAPKLKTDVSQPRQFVFVIDESGSMGGEPIKQAKIAFSSIIASLSASDRFNVLSYNDEVTSLWQESRSASFSNKEAALTFVNLLQAGGSTNIYDAIVEGFESFADTAHTNNGMFFLSDGHPTSGPYQENEPILSNIKEKNTKQISISTVSFGEGADFNLMGKIAAQNNGVTARIGTSGDAANEIIRFYSEQFSANVLEWEFTIEGAQALNFKPKSNSLFINGSEIIITGQFDSHVQISVNLQYEDGTQTSLAGANAGTISNSKFAHIERAWAIQRIEYLIGNNEPEVEIIELALYYGLTVETYTAMVLTELYAGNAEDQRAGQFTTVVVGNSVSTTATLVNSATIPSLQQNTTIRSADFVFFAVIIVPIAIFLLRVFFVKKIYRKSQ